MRSWKALTNGLLRRAGYEIRRLPGTIASPDPGPAPQQRRLGSAGDAREGDWLPKVLGIKGQTQRSQVVALHDLARATTGGCIVEVGSYRGRSTAALAYGSRSGARVPIYAVEPHAQFIGVWGGNYGPADRAAFYRSMLRTGAWELVRLVNLSSEIVTPGWSEPIAFLFIDGDHSYEGVKRDYDCWSPHLMPGAVVALDDTNKDGGPAQLARELVQAGWEVDLTYEVGQMTVLRRVAVGEPRVVHR